MPNLRTPSADYTVAVHEAGHAFMACLCSFPFEYVTIDDETGDQGKLQCEVPDETYDLHSPDDRVKIEKYVLVSLAGWIAQSRDVRARNNPFIDAVDQTEAWEWCQRLSGVQKPSERRDSMLAKGCCAVHTRIVTNLFNALADTYETAIDALVSALLARRTLSAKHVHDLLDERVSHRT